MTAEVTRQAPSGTGISGASKGVCGVDGASCTASALPRSLDNPSWLFWTVHLIKDAFASAVGGSIVTKALYARTPRDANGYPTGVLYTAEVSPHQYSDPGIAATAHLFQARIKGVYDVRLTVVGDKLFAAEIHRESVGGGWTGVRTTGIFATSRAMCQPRSRTACGKMCLLELTFGALDFAVDAAGSWWFYEINPNGQWLWIERQTGLPISASLAELLEGR